MLNVSWSLDTASHLMVCSEPVRHSSSLEGEVILSAAAVAARASRERKETIVAVLLFLMGEY